MLSSVSPITIFIIRSSSLSFSFSVTLSVILPVSESRTISQREFARLLRETDSYCFLTFIKTESDPLRLPDPTFMSTGSGSDPQENRIRVRPQENRIRVPPSRKPFPDPTLKKTVPGSNPKKKNRSRIRPSRKPLPELNSRKPF